MLQTQDKGKYLICPVIPSPHCCCSSVRKYVLDVSKEESPKEGGGNESHFFCHGAAVIIEWKESRYLLYSASETIEGGRVGEGGMQGGQVEGWKEEEEGGEQTLSPSHCCSIADKSRHGMFFFFPNTSFPLFLSPPHFFFSKEQSFPPPPPPPPLSSSSCLAKVSTILSPSSPSLHTPFSQLERGGKN